jgi:hypothetical protein
LFGTVAASRWGGLFGGGAACSSGASSGGGLFGATASAGSGLSGGGAGTSGFDLWKIVEDNLNAKKGKDEKGDLKAETNSNLFGQTVKTIDGSNGDLIDTSEPRGGIGLDVFVADLGDGGSYVNEVGAKLQKKNVKRMGMDYYNGVVSYGEDEDDDEGIIEHESLGIAKYDDQWQSDKATGQGRFEHGAAEGYQDEAGTRAEEETYDYGKANGYDYGKANGYDYGKGSTYDYNKGNAYDYGKGSAYDHNEGEQDDHGEQQDDYGEQRGAEVEYGEPHDEWQHMSGE